MNKKLLAGGLLLCTSALAQAQGSSVTIYGIVDTGVQYLSNVAVTGGSASVWRMPTNTATFPSRIGFRGTEDLGDGLAAIFTLENGFGADTGALNQGGRLFGRQAFVGLSSSSWGAVTVGRQYSMTYWGMLESDILGPNVFGSGSLDAYLPNAREDNAIAYRGRFGGFTLGATYSFGRDATTASVATPAATNCAGENAADTQQCRAWSLLLKYDAASWGVSATYDRQNGGSTGSSTVAATYGSLTSSGLHDTRTTLNGYAKFGDVKVGGGVLMRKNDGAKASTPNTPTPRSNLYYLGASWLVTPALVLDGEVYRLDYKNSGNDSNLIALRATYQLSKRTATYVTAGRISNGGTATTSVDGGQSGATTTAGGAQNGVMLGVRHTF